VKIKVIHVGKTKDSYVKEGMSEFVKRIGAFANLEFVEVREVVTSATFTKGKCMEQEGVGILKTIKEDEFVFVLDEGGRQYGSVEFAELISEKKDLGTTITFVIGGPFGLDMDVKKRADVLFSMSKMTFTHQMIRLFLLEQIYRGLCIIHGKEYHNE